MKAIYFSIIGLISTITVFAQEKCLGNEIEKENIKLAKNIFQTETEVEKINENSYVSKLSTMSDEKFNALCERFEYNPNFERVKKTNPNLSSYVMYAKNFAGETNLYCAILDNYKKELENLPKDAKKRLQIIDNTIKLYKDLQDVLDKEMRYNRGEIIDNGINLAIKHVPDVLPKTEITGIIRLNKDITNLIGKDIMQYVKDETSEKLLKKDPPIDNLVADNMNALFAMIDHLYILGPATKVVTKAPLYKVFVSLPEAGKIIGHVATSINIYFRKNEYENLIAELEKEKRYIIGNKQLGPVIR